MTPLHKAIGRERYPGRGIVLGRHADGRAVLAYFIMGRSENSQNRVFEPVGSDLRTRAFDPAKLRDPSLILYAPVRALPGRQIVTNGDQTDTIYDALRAGGTFEDALRARVYEPDAPNFTPRVSGLVTFADGAFSYKLAILKKGCGCERFFFEYEAPVPGLGHFLHTYERDGAPIPSFSGEPEPVSLTGDVGQAIWAALDPEYRVSLFVRLIDPKTQSAEDTLINRLTEA